MRNQFAKLRKQLKKNFPRASLDIVRQAYRRADEAHRGQTRLSGEPYVLHSLEVANILAGIGLDPVTCAAGLLHDVLEDTDTKRGELEQEFGDEIAALVDAVTKIGALNFPEDVVTREAKQAQNIRKMLVATARDARVILIKLADRLHNMRTIEYLGQEKRERIARETLDIYAPLAHRLGISQWKWELEDHAFHQLWPEVYKAIAQQVAMKRRDRELELQRVIEFLEERLKEGEVEARVIGRPKHLYSIYRKMVEQGKDFNELTDVLAVRIITQTEMGCYNALGVVHRLWTPMPGRMKDYIAMPKLNMYQAIHTTVMRENGRPMEVQIRTEDMDRTAREGIAAHWSYKEGQRRDTHLDDQLLWLRQMYDWLKDAHAPDELMDNMRQDFSSAHIYVFTPKGEVKELPDGATPLDFAYLIHSDVGHQCIGVRVNGRIVPFRYHLQMGDVVEILTSPNQAPQPEWIDFVRTGRARTRIRQRLRELGELDPDRDPATRSPVQDEPDLPGIDAGWEKPPIRHVDEATRHKLLRFDETPDGDVQFAGCCNPMPGQPVIGYRTKRDTVTIHRGDCKSLVKSKPEPARIVAAFWEGEELFETAMRVITGARPNVLADLTSALRPMNIEIVRAEFVPAARGEAHFDFVFSSSDSGAVERVRRTLEVVAGVFEVQVLTPPRRVSEALAARVSRQEPSLAEAG